MITLYRIHVKNKESQLINRFIDKSITRQQAAELLGLSTRQVTHIKKGVLESGAESLIHKNTGRKPPHALSDETKEAILMIYSRPELSGINFLHFKDILLADFGIDISYSALLSILKNEGFESPKKKKIRHRTHRRKRKPHPGKVVGLFMTQNECLYGYLETLRQCCLDFGVPQTVYSDNHTIFRSPKTGKLTTDELIAGKEVHLTQFGRAMHELGVDLIFAKTPQAKGRIERLWVTLQSRLPVELAKQGITTVSEANRFLENEYRALFNQKFSIEPEAESIFVPLGKNVDIDSVLCVKHTRKTDSAGVFSFKNRCFQILDRGFPIIGSRTEITVLMNPRFGIRVEYQGRVYDTIRGIVRMHGKT